MSVLVAVFFHSIWKGTDPGGRCKKWIYLQYIQVLDPKSAKERFYRRVMGNRDENMESCFLLDFWRMDQRGRTCRCFQNSWIQEWGVPGKLELSESQRCQKVSSLETETKYKNCFTGAKVGCGLERRRGGEFLGLFTGKSILLEWLSRSFLQVGEGGPVSKVSILQVSPQQVNRFQDWSDADRQQCRREKVSGSQVGP